MSLSGPPSCSSMTMHSFADLLNIYLDVAPHYNVSNALVSKSFPSCCTSSIYHVLHFVKLPSATNLRSLKHGLAFYPLFCNLSNFFSCASMLTPVELSISTYRLAFQTKKLDKSPLVQRFLALLSLEEQRDFVAQNMKKRLNP